MKRKKVRETFLLSSCIQRVRNEDMKLGFVHEDGTGGVTCVLCEVEDEHDLHEEDGFRAAVTEGCAALGRTRGEWEFKFPHEELSQGVRLIKCRPRGSTPVLPAFGES